MSAFEWVTESLKQDIQRFEQESEKHKTLYRRSQTATILLTAITTIVAGAGLILPETSARGIQFTVLCLTATSAAVTGWAEMRRARELWQHEREVYYALIDIRREIEFLAASKELTPAELEAFFKRIAAVLGSSSQKWARIQEKKTPTPAQEN